MKPGPLQSQWLADLRSGKYPQTKEFLHDNGGYCCLGVACAVTLGMQADDIDPSGVRYYVGEDQSLPVSVQEKFRFRGNAGESSDFPALAKLNDEGKTFAEIADWGRSPLRGLLRSASLNPQNTPCGRVSAPELDREGELAGLK